MAEHLAMHQEHAQWAAEHLEWDAEIARWQHEHEGLVERLAEVERRMRSEARELAAYRDALRAGDSTPERHEIEIARHERGGRRGEEHEAMAEVHRTAARRHAEEREEHRRRAARRKEIEELAERMLGILGPPAPSDDVRVRPRPLAAARPLARRRPDPAQDLQLELRLLPARLHGAAQGRARGLRAARRDRARDVRRARSSA